MASKMTSTLCNISYDLLTIFISIADVTTDIIVLVSFYENDRMVFFGISLSILILAQCSYAIACAVRFDTVDEWGEVLSCIAFCCLLPFGSFVAFCIYLADENNGVKCFRKFIRWIKLEEDGFLSVSNNDSKITKWIKTKLSKHMGFILEAGIEAFPQSLLQITAIVYYQETNYIAIASILISMFSVMSKSLILSQGIDKSTFAWTWLCVVTDFFGVFFTLSWVFYSNDFIHGNFLGYFNIFGEIWLYKIFIAILPPISLGLATFVLFGYWVVMIAIVYKGYSHYFRDACLWAIFGPIMAALCAFIAGLCGEVLCFSFFAFFLYFFSTIRVVDYYKITSSEFINSVVRFITKQRTNRLIRIIAINWGISKCENACSDVGFYIKTLPNYQRLKNVKYKDLRRNCSNPKKANLITYVFEEIMGELTYRKLQMKHHYHSDECVPTSSYYIVLILVVFVFGPILALSKILQVLYPWIILFYLIYNNLLFTDQIHLFQLSMLGIYISLQLILLILGIYVFRTHWYLWHINPGQLEVRWNGYNIEEVLQASNKYYDDIVWYPQVNKMVTQYFGNDLGNIIMYYVKLLETVTFVDDQETREIYDSDEATDDIRNTEIELIL